MNATTPRARITKYIVLSSFPLLSGTVVDVICVTSVEADVSDAVVL
jgi:hypothetical protein